MTYNLSQRRSSDRSRPGTPTVSTLQEPEAHLNSIRSHKDVSGCMAVPSNQLGILELVVDVFGAMVHAYSWVWIGDMESIIPLFIHISSLPDF